MNRSILLPLLGMAASCPNGVKAQGQSDTKKPLNIIYIMSDDHSQQTISCYDGRFNQTPNIDSLAANGVRFTNSFVTNSISGPSRAVLLTGKHSHLNGRINNRIPFDGAQQTFPKLLQQAGYQTAMIGKWHLETTPTGFDHWTILPGQGSYYNPDFITPEGNQHVEGYVTDIITDKGIDWIENRDQSKPFCMLLHHKAVHRDWMADTADLALYEEVKFDVPQTYFDNYEGRNAAALQKMSVERDMDLVYDLKMYHPDTVTGLSHYYSEIQRMNPAQRAAWDSMYVPMTTDFYASKLTGKELAEWKYQRYMRDYLKCVYSLDQNIGRLVAYLREKGLLENTLIVYTSDQGFYMGEHGWFDKRFMYEESLRTPMVARIPDNWEAPRGVDITQMVQNIDYAPTFLALAGIEVPSDIQGVSMEQLLKGEKVKNWRKSIYYHYFEFPGEHDVRRHYGVRTDRYKLIHFYDPKDKSIDSWELYDLKSDPSEMTNIYNNTKYKATQAKMHSELERQRDLYNDHME